MVRQTADEVTVSMSIKDDFEYSAAPARFRRGSTGIEATYYVTLKADRAALDARVVLKNPQSAAIDYEYWTCATLAPGSDPKNPKATGGAEIIASIATYTTPGWSANIAAGEESAGTGKGASKTCATSRIGQRWASPMLRQICRAANFWGAINHDNAEGIIRIADNTLTPGLKMWTWGFP